MRKKSMMYVVIVAIATMFLTSCNRYDQKELLKHNDITNVPWNHVVTDSVQKNMVRYFMIMGEKNRPEVAEVLIHKQFNLLYVPNNLIKDIPAYHDCFYKGEQMIAEKEVHRTSGPTLWKAPQVTFTLKVMDPINFDQATIKIIERDARIFWQVVLIFFYLLFGFLGFALFNTDDDENLGWGIFLFIVAIGMLVWNWFYVPYFVSGFLTLLLLTAVVWQIVYMVRQSRKQNQIEVN